MSKLISGVLFVAMFVGLGWWMSYSSKSSPDQYVSQNYSGSRDPAAIRKSYDFSDLDGIALADASKQRLLAGARVLKESSDLGIELGHFVVRSESGEKVFACKQYQKIVLQFDGDGMAVGGERPLMEVEGACEVSADINRMAPLWIPVAKILGEPAADGEFDFRSEHPIKLKFKNVADAWPVAWVLKNVRLESESGQSVEINQDDLRNLTPRPVVLEFQ